MIQHAFKEWAVICKALSEGRQSLILRKGGIAEEGGVFKPDHADFWLYPTFAHQQRDGIKADALPLLQMAESEPSSPGLLRFSTFARVTEVYWIQRLDEALSLDPLHVWSADTVMKRFAYRQPGLYALAVRIYRLPQPHEVPFKPEYDGCKTWVELDQELPTETAVPVLDDARYAELLDELNTLLNPRAYC